MKLKHLFLLPALFISLMAPGQDLPDPPAPGKGLVIDEIGLLTATQEQSLERFLQSYEDTTSTQIVVYIVSTVEDDINLYAAEIAHHWGIGQKGSDNGCIMLVARDSRIMAIQNGYGLEPYLTDAKTRLIIENYILPEFRNDRYYEGISAGVVSITKVLNGTFEGTPGRDNNKGRYAGLILIAIIIVFILISRGGGSGGNRGGRYRHGPRGFWIGGFGGGHGGGGFGGGGFGGFGGGGFGGGGASGSW